VVIVPIDTRLDKVVTVSEINAPEVGSVIAVGPVNVKPSEYAPVVEKDPAVDIFPPSVMVLEPLFTPVPP
jgi:hypothetical protein